MQQSHTRTLSWEAGVLLSLLLVIALTAFLASDASRNLDRLLTVSGVLVFFLLCLLVGYHVGQAAAPFVGAVVAVAALIVALYGHYAAYAIGWHGLDPHDLGGDDWSGHAYVVIALGLSSIPVAVAGAVLGFTGSLLPGHRK